MLKMQTLTQEQKRQLSAQHQPSFEVICDKAPSLVCVIRACDSARLRLRAGTW